MPQVIVTIDPEGNTKVEAAGVVGSSCAELTRAIEQAIGETTADVKKPEFFRSAEQAARGGQKAGQ